MDEDRRPSIGLSEDDLLEQALALHQSGGVPEGDPPDDPEGDLPQGGLIRSTFRGAGKAFNEMSSTAWDLGAAVYRKFDPLEEGEEPVENPIQLPVDPRSPGGVWGFYEGMVQFGVGMLPFSKGLKAAGLVDDAFRGAVAVRGAVAGLGADFTAFDPHEERLSDLIESGPEWVRNPVTAYLAADEDDGVLEGRMKNALEGLLVGAAFESAVAGIKIARARRKLRDGKISEDEAVEEVRSAVADEAPEGDPVVDFGQAEDGGWEVRVSDDAASELGLSAEQATSTYTDATQAMHVATALNEAVRTMVGRAGRGVTPGEIGVTASEVDGIQTVARRILDGGDPADLEGLTEGIDLNFRRVTSPDETKAYINALNEVLADEFAQARAASGSEDGVRRWSQTRARANRLRQSTTDREIAAGMRELYGATEHLPEQILLGRMILQAQARRLSRMSFVAEIDPNNPLVSKLLATELDTFATLAVHLTGTKSNIARTLNAMAIPVGDTGRALGKGRKGRTGGQPPAGGGKPKADPVQGPRKITGREFDNLINGRDPNHKLTPAELRALARGIRMTGGDADAALKLMRLTVKAAQDGAEEVADTWLNRLIGFRASMMLSGVKTQAVNATSSLLSALQLPTEIAIGGALTGQKEITRFGLDMLAAPFAEGGMILRESMHALRQSFKLGDNLLDPYFHKLEGGNLLKAPAQEPANWMSTILGLPQRTLMSVDEFVKQLAYRSHVRAQSLQQVRQEIASGAKHTSDGIAARLHDDLEAAIGIDGSAVNPTALTHARTSTFTNQLTDGPAKHLMDAANQYPAIRLIMPFIRTPVNIFRYSLERTPALGMIRKQMRADFAAGGVRRAQAVAKQAMGLTAYSAGATLAYSGLMTGNGPSDPKLRQQLLDTGWQPYSIRVGNKYLSFRRLEPIATPLAVVADMVESLGELDEATAEETMIAIGTGFTSAMTSKTFLIGITEFFDAVASGQEYKVKNFLGSFASSFAPALLRQADPDPVWREARTLVDDVRRAVPGWSATLEPRRNIFGEPVMKPAGYFNRSFNPFTFVAAPEDDVLQAFVDLGRAMPMPRKDWGENRDIDLTDRSKWDNGTGQSPYDRWLEITSELGLREALTNVVRSQEWQDASPGTETYPGGARHMIAAKIIQSYHDAAKAKMLQEYPKLQDATSSEQLTRIESLFAPTLN